MTQYKFEILQSQVFERISVLTHYTGAKAVEDSSAYERISTIDANDEILSRFWKQAVNQLVIFIAPFSGNVFFDKTEEDGTKTHGIFAQLEMNSNWDSHLLPACISAAENYLVARIAELWFRMTDKTAVEAQVADATTAATELRILLYSKTRPQLPDYLCDDDESVELE